MGYEVRLRSFPPKRIVSLVPSQTELLFDLGLEEEVIGITKFCIHPKEQFKAKSKVGGTKDFSIEKIRALQPDLIIGNKEENEEQGIKALQEEFPVWMSDIVSLEDALGMIEGVGAVTGKQHTAYSIQQAIKTAYQDVPALNPPKRAAYFIWKKPYMLAGPGTFIDEQLKSLGLQNIASGARYPEIDLESLAKAEPVVILLSSEPYPFKDKHIEEFRAVCPKASIHIVDGELFSWYGSRLQRAPAYFKKLLPKL